MSKKPSIAVKGGKRAGRNIKITMSLLLIPLIVGGFSLYYVFASPIAAQLGYDANNRLLTKGWETAESELAATEPAYGTRFSDYKLLPGQSLEWVAAHFSVDIARLRQLNPGTVVPGTTIHVPPVEHKLQPLPIGASNFGNLTVQQVNGVINVANDFRNPVNTLTIPELMQVLQPYHAISQIGAKDFVIEQPINIIGNIRMDITDATVKTLYLKSAPNFDIVTLTFRDSEALLQNMTVTTMDPTTHQQDKDYTDGRSFLRAYGSARMDLINSHALYMGMGLDTLKTAKVTPPTSTMDFVGQGGVYGVSWRIPTGTYGENIATGWVEKSTLDHEYIGAYTFGASGMMWRDNIFTDNTLYGLDPHDDSNNATVEGNYFARNQKHGFIVSKRCNYNVIRNNISVDNHLHGFMLHQDSNYNLLQNNISIGNEDNFVVYESHYNALQNNKSYNPRGSHVRINANAKQTYVQSNIFYGGGKGIYVYDHAAGILVANNTFYHVTQLVFTQTAERILFAHNQSEKVGYHLGTSQDRLVFGPNKINSDPKIDLKPLSQYTNLH